MTKESSINRIIEVTCNVHGLSFRQIGRLDYLVNGKTVKLRQCELTHANRQMVDLLEIKMLCAMGPYSHRDDPYGK